MLPYFCVFKKKKKIPFYCRDFRMCLWCNVCFLCVHVWSFYIVIHPVCCCYALWKVASLPPLLAQLSKVFWNGLSFLCSPAAILSVKHPSFQLVLDTSWVCFKGKVLLSFLQSSGLLLRKWSWTSVSQWQVNICSLKFLGLYLNTINSVLNFFFFFV